MSAPRALVLLGRDYVEFGTLGLVSLPEGGALGLSRGAYPKAYAHVDPNEDGALLYRCESGALLAIADGHNGVRACELAIETVHARAAKLVEATGDRFARQVRELIIDLTARLAHAGRSRTCLIMAALQGAMCQFALFGDCSVWRARDSEAPSVPNDLFLGPDFKLEQVPEDVWYGGFACESGERIALVSDGVTNFVPDPGAIHRWLRDARADLDAARTLAEAALKGGAGDNVAVATLGGLV